MLQDEQHYINLMRYSLESPGFYYSDSYNLTYSKQHFDDAKSPWSNENPSGSVNELMTWNYHMFNALRDEVKLTKSVTLLNENFFVPFIHGFVELFSNSKNTYGVISRRNVRRAGTRFCTRGVDPNGDASNFVETEQICIIDEHHICYVQVRGSIPLYWKQEPDLAYKPPIYLQGLPRKQSAEFLPVEQSIICRRHLDKVNYLYQHGKLVAINLIDQTGGEAQLAECFAKASGTVNKDELKYVAFDFHKECGSSNWDRLTVLINHVIDDLKRFGAYHTVGSIKGDSKKSVISRQTGVFRTNCIDCLDRTNVVQSMLARRLLEHVLSQQQSLMAVVTAYSGDKGKDSTMADRLDGIWGNFDSKFKNLWADHADFISIQYSGTPALKTDFTRTGKRTLIGKLMDGYNSLKRYYLNNFRDGQRQDGLNLLLGYCPLQNSDGQLKEGITSILRRRSFKEKYLMYINLFLFSLTSLALLFPVESFNQKAVGVCATLTLFVLSLGYTKKNGRALVDVPRLEAVLPSDD